MAFIPSKNAQNLAKQTAIQPNLILEIENIPIIFGSQDISRFWKLDDGFEFDTTNLRFDTPFPDPNARDYISLKKTSKTISQQVLPDKGATSSTLTMDIELVDYNGEVTEILKSDNNIEDLIGQRASTFIGFKQGSHPEDSIPLIDGFIQKIKPVHGGYVLTISHSENKKRQDIFESYTSTLSSNIDDVVTTIPVESTLNIIDPSSTLVSYIQIEDEIMEIVSVDSAVQFTVIRSRLGTTSILHEAESDISSVYGLQGNAIDLALKLYLSGGDEFYQTLAPTSFNQVNSDVFPDVIFFQDIDLIADVNLTIGDSITITGATNAANNGTFSVTNITSTSNGTYLTSAGSGFILEQITSASVSFKSQFNVFNIGCGLTPFDVDIASHIDEQDQNSASFPNYQFYLKEEVSAKDFIDTQLYFPSGLYSINRNAKISCKYTKPPLATEETTAFNSSNITNISNIMVSRSTTAYMYNSVVFKYEKSVRDDEYKAGTINVNPTAKKRTDNINHTLRVESDGLRRTGGTFNLIERQTNRFYQRYQYGATVYSNIQVLFGDAWTLEIGDIVEFGGTDVKIPDLSAGTTYTPKRFVEIINIAKNIESGVATFTCLDTGFDLTARFAVFSPSSYVSTNSTTSKLELELSFYTGKVVTEREKWQSYVGERIRVRSEDYTFDEIVTIESLAPENDEVLNITPALSSLPAGLLVEIPDYDETSADIDRSYKLRYAYRNLQSTITSVLSTSTFDVTDGSQFKVGGVIQVHSDDYVRDSGDSGVEILTINTDTITLKEPLLFTPSINDKVQKLSFLDDSFAYKFI